MKRDETYVHVAIRSFLKKEGWLLIAGQYPGGSDDELHTLNIVDPELAKDGSPDHRRHSFGKLVPDLIAYKEKNILVVEAKPEYSQNDREKLIYLINDRRTNFVSDLEKFLHERNIQINLPLNETSFVPALAFLDEFNAPDNDFCYLKVTDLKTVRFENLILK